MGLITELKMFTKEKEKDKKSKKEAENRPINS